MSDKQSTKKISAKAIMTDLKAELSDSDLMKKYGISFQALQDLFAKLVQAKLVPQAFFDKRAVNQAARPSAKPLSKSHTCPYCGFETAEKFKKCPRCGQDTSEWLDTVELTKMLTFE